MPRKKKKYEEYVSLGYRSDGSRIRKFIAADRKTEFDRLKRAAVIEASKVRNPSAITLGKYADKWFSIYKVNQSIQTRNEYQYAIDKLKPIRCIPIKDVTSSDLQSIINEHSGHPRSCQQLKSTLCQIWKQAIKDGIIYPLNIAEDLTMPQYVCKEQRFITDSEMEKILAAEYKEQDRLYLEMLRNTGMRPSEALALQWSDLDLKENSITVRRSFQFDNNNPVIKSTKTGKIRSIPISEKFSAMLSDLPKSGIFLFTYADGQPMTKSVYRRMSARILRQINLALGGTDKLKVIGNMTMYSFRHTYATNLYYNAVKPGIISTKKAAQIMGHSEEMFLKRYTHLDDDKEKMTELTEALFPSKKPKKSEILKVGRPKGDQETKGRPEKSVKIG